MVNLIKDNWIAISAIGAAILSEALPFLPTKYNGIAHIVLDLLKIKKVK